MQSKYKLRIKNSQINIKKDKRFLLSFPHKHLLDCSIEETEDESIFIFDLSEHSKFSEALDLKLKDKYRLLYNVAELNSISDRYIVDITNTILTSLRFPLFLFITGGIIFNILTGFENIGLLISLIYMTIVIGIVITIPTVIIVKLIYMLIGKFTTRKVIEKIITFMTFFIGLGIYLLFDIYNETVMKFISNLTNGHFDIFNQFTNLILGYEVLKAIGITLLFTVIIMAVLRNS